MPIGEVRRRRLMPGEAFLLGLHAIRTPPAGRAALRQRLEALDRSDLARAVGLTGARMPADSHRRAVSFLEKLTDRQLSDMLEAHRNGGMAAARLQLSNIVREWRRRKGGGSL
ncbi:hypothetical protein HYS54_00240 [Candidatus Micrarchaeota archaeon]|nr:hypothetical protein [Candidatus Micrarchaeota archaeon]